MAINGNIIVEVLIIVLIITLFLAVVPQNKEVGSGEEATIACVVSGLTAQLDGVKWENVGGEDVTSITAKDNYVVTAGVFGGNSQTTTLKVLGASTLTDATYFCVITSIEWALTADKTAVTLNVFSK